MPSASSVGLGELRVSRAQDEILVAYGLGSCLAVAIYDPAARVAGLLHAVLPSRNRDADPLSAKFVDSGIEALCKSLQASGAQMRSLIVRLAGGANMLLGPAFPQGIDIGDRNVAAARQVLAQMGLAIAAEDVGGHSGRTIRLYVADGRMTVRLLGQAEREM